MKEELKELLTPTPKKVLVFFILSVILITVEYSDKVWYYQGLPSPLYKWGGPDNIHRDHAISVDYSIVTNLIIWYLLACLLSWFLTYAYNEIYG